MTDQTTPGERPYRTQHGTYTVSENGRVRTWNLDGGGFTTLRIPLGTLNRGDQIIGEDGTRYEVTGEAIEHPHGWLFVRSLSMTDEQVAEYLAKTPGDPGCDPRDGFFAYPDTTGMNLVLPDEDTDDDTDTDEF